MTDPSPSTAIITGASGNLGRAVIAALRQRGARLVLFDRAAARVHAIHGEASDFFVPGDVDLTDPPAVANAVERAISRFGRIDALINTAGGFRADHPVHEEPLETWDAMLRVNLRSVLLPCRAVVPQMLRQGHGRIVNVAAMAGLAAFARAGAYSASKAAVIRLTEALAAELKGSGVTANCVLPGTLDTPQNRAAMPDADPGKWVAPADLAEIIAFLASDAARAITGAAIPVAGAG